MPKDRMTRRRQIILVIILGCFVLLAAGCTTRVVPNGAKVYGFYDPTCPCCKKSFPGTGVSGQRYESRIQFITCDVTEPENARRADLFKIKRVPTFVFVNEHGKVIDTLAGPVSQANLDTFISKNISKCRSGS